MRPVALWLSWTVAAGSWIPVSAQVSDTAPPDLTALTFGPNPANITAGPVTLTVDFTVTDNLAGAQTVYAGFRSPTGLQFVYPAQANRISGTPLSGLWRGTVPLPQFSEAGVWKIEVYLWDAARNFISFPSSALAAKGLPTDLTVVSIPDTQPPAVTSIAISPSTVDVSGAQQTVNIDLTLTDNVSGVRFTNEFPGCCSATVGVRSPTRRQSQYIYNSAVTPVSGSTLSGVWRAAIPIPRYSEPGLWTIDFIQLYDQANNTLVRTTPQLQGAGLATTFSVASTPADTAPPQLTSMSFTPAAFDTSTTSQLVRVQFRVTEDLSGIGQYQNPPYTFGPLSVSFASPSGGQSTSISFGFDTQLISGTPLNGVWEGTAFFPRYSEAGTWKANFASLRDRASNTLSLNTANLTALGFPTDLVIIRPSLDPDGTAGAGGGTVADQTFGNRATVIFPPGALPGTTTVAIDVLVNPPAIPTPAGFSTGSYFTNISLTPAPPMPFPAPGLTLALPLSQFRSPGSNLTLFRLDAVTGSLVPAINVSGGNVVGTVGPDGLTATFAGVARLSTVVAFQANTLLGDVNGDGRVDCQDVAIVRAAFGKRPGQSGYDFRADVNRDGIVNVLDLTIVTRQLPPGTVCR